MDDKRQFIEALLRYQVLEFGDFTTKSGRPSPYFFNTGRFNSAESMEAVARLYARALVTHFGERTSFLFGPAYKGIPLAVMVAAHLRTLTGRNIYFTFNRKEVKDHGEGGGLVGYAYQGGEEVVIVEDVLTGGTSIRESLTLLKTLPVKVIGALVGVDRGERGLGAQAASSELASEFKIPIFSLVHINDIISLLGSQELLGRRWISPTQQARINSYRQAYGPSA